MRSRAALGAYANNVRRRRWRRRLVVSGEPVLTAESGVAYDGFAMSATGGVQPYTFLVVYGVLPDGMLVDPETGAVSGTPTETGEFPVTFGVRDDSDRRAELPTVTITVT